LRGTSESTSRKSTAPLIISTPKETNCGKNKDITETDATFPPAAEWLDHEPKRSAFKKILAPKAANATPITEKTFLARKGHLTITYVTKSRGENRLFAEFGGRIASMTLYMALEVVACS
jgi:hypothetical protein